MRRDTTTSCPSARSNVLYTIVATFCYDYRSFCIIMAVFVRLLQPFARLSQILCDYPSVCTIIAAFVRSTQLFARLSQFSYDYRSFCTIITAFTLGKKEPHKKTWPEISEMRKIESGLCRIIRKITQPMGRFWTIFGAEFLHNKGAHIHKRNCFWGGGISLRFFRRRMHGFVVPFEHSLPRCRETKFAREFVRG